MNAGVPIHATVLHHEGSDTSIAVLEKAVRIIAGLDVSTFNNFACAVNLADYARALKECP